MRLLDESSMSDCSSVTSRFMSLARIILVCDDTQDGPPQFDRTWDSVVHLIWNSLSLGILVFVVEALGNCDAQIARNRVCFANLARPRVRLGERCAAVVDKFSGGHILVHHPWVATGGRRESSKRAKNAEAAVAIDVRGLQYGPLCAQLEPKGLSRVQRHVLFLGGSFLQCPD